MKVLVTGGLGFMGSNFIRYLLEESKMKETYNIINIDKIGYGASKENLKDLENKENYLFIKKDISANFKDIEKSIMDVDIIINFAAETHVDRSISSPVSFIKNNINSVLNILEFMRHSKKEIKLIHISTDEVYGEAIDGSFTENDRLKPSSPYASSKAAGEMLIMGYTRTYGLNTVIVRSSNNYGPFQFPEKLIPKTIILAINNREIPVYGTGKNVRDYIYVKDFCKAIELLIHSNTKKGEIFNVSSGEELQVIEIVKKILDLLKKPYDLIKFVEDRPGHDLRYSIDSSKIRKKFGWSPRYNFNKGIKDTVNWYIKNEKWWKNKINEKILSSTPWKLKW